MITEVQSTKSQAISSTSGSQGAQTAAATKEQFLQLLVTQLQHQDPLNPMDAKEFTAQLAQFSLLEQALETNKQLRTLALYEASANNARAVGLIGKEIVAQGDQVTVGEQGAGSIHFRLFSDGAQSQVYLYDSSGRLVRTMDLGPLAAGDQSIPWDGKDQQGRSLPAGTYRVEVSVKDSKGKSVEVEQYLRGRATSASFREGTTSLLVNGVTVPLGSILEVLG